MKKKYTQLQKRSNLAKLAKAMLTRRFKVNFRMSLFASGEDGALEPHQIKNHCGTTCCALGHAPLVLKDTIKYQDWEDYCEDTFIKFESLKGLFLFSPYWDDDKKQFAARAYHYLKNRKITIDNCNEKSGIKFPVPKKSDFDQFIIP